MPKPSLKDKTFDELKELAQVGVAFMELAQKYASVVDLPKPKRKRRRRKAEAGNGENSKAWPKSNLSDLKDKAGAKKTRGKAPAVPKPQGSKKIPRKDIPPLPEEE